MTCPLWFYTSWTLYFIGVAYVLRIFNKVSHEMGPSTIIALVLWPLTALLSITKDLML